MPHLRRCPSLWNLKIVVSDPLQRLFCQRFPFFQNAEVVKAARLEEVADAVSNTEIKYDFGPWPQMSKEGVEFIKLCLTRPEIERMSLAEAMNHPWILKFISEEDRRASGVSSAA